MLVSLGSFHTIRTWTWTCAQRNPTLHLELEQFYQDALYHIVPYQARAYDPSFGSSFQSFVVDLLKKRFTTFVNEQIREQSAPVRYEEKPASKMGRPKASRERVVFARLDSQMPRSDTPQTHREYFEATHFAVQDTTQAEDQEAQDKIHLLAELAGLNDKQEETLIALYIYGGDTTLISHMRQRTPRMVRMYRQDALNKIEQLGYETVQEVLTGSYSTRTPQTGR
jgi:DNA-directed RNA polymerase specialized sigma24 family protein